jgi:hypothetical protein
VLLCFTRLLAAVCEFLRVFVVFEISTGSCFGHYQAWKTGSDVTIRFLDLTLYKWPVDIYCLFPLKSYSTVLFWIEIAVVTDILRVLGILDPLMHVYINETPKGT